MEHLIDIMKPEDWEQVSSIYLEGIATGNSTLVVRVGDSVIAWTALSPVSTRCIYSGVAELSIYVAAKHRAHIPHFEFGI